jgi:hypothetical protein
VRYFCHPPSTPPFATVDFYPEISPLFKFHV